MKLLKKVEKILPGIQKKIVHLETGTPKTLERYTSNFMGSSYAWSQVSRLKAYRSKIRNLYIVGHWGETGGGGGVASAYSGMKAARDILKKGE